MRVNVPPDLEALVQKRLDSGAFASAEDVIRCAWKLWTLKRVGPRKNAALSTMTRPTRPS